jgi:hypothetical protein
MLPVGFVEVGAPEPGAVFRLIMQKTAFTSALSCRRLSAWCKRANCANCDGANRR